MNPKDKHTQCWCKYPAEDCGNVGCSEKPHRQRLIVVAHYHIDGIGMPAELWCEMDGDIHYCPVCGKELKHAIHNTRKKRRN